MEFLSLKKEMFGLDISDLSLKIIMLKKKNNFLELSSFGKTIVKPGIIQDGEIKDENALANIIQKALIGVQGDKIKTKYTVVSLPEKKAFLQVIKMPAMETDEIKKAIRFEAENYIPLPMEKSYLDFKVLNKTQEGDNFYVNILIAAMSRSVVDPYVSVLKKAGLVPISLEVESSAISRSLVRGESSEMPMLLVDIGASRTSFIVFFGNSLRFTSSVSFSSKGLKEIISKSLDINLNKAEELKRKIGINRKTTQGKKIHSVLSPALSGLAKDIRSCLNYYYSYIFSLIQPTRFHPL